MLEDMPWQLSSVLIFGTLVIFFAIGVPIGFAMGVVGVGTLLLTVGFDYVLIEAPSIIFNKLDNSIYVIFPLFILMTEFMAYSGMSKRLVQIAHTVMGRFPGSLAAVAVVASTIFGAICGSSAIAAMALSEMLIPECMERDYDKGLIAGAIAAGGNLSTIIPPSFVLILWGILAEESIGELFMAGIIPGVLIASMFIIYIMIRAKRNPALAPLPPATSSKEKIVALGRGWEIWLVILIIIGGIYTGTGTLTEVAAVAALATLIFGLARRTLRFYSLSAALRRAASMTAFFVVLLIGAFLLIHAIAYLRIPQSITEWVVDADLSATLLIIAVQVLFFVLGMFIDPGSVMLISLPLFLPALRELDVDLVWFGVVISISCMIANLTPPVGVNLFIVQGIGRAHGMTIAHVIRGTVPFILIMIVAMALVIAIPGLATWLPSVME